MHIIYYWFVHAYVVDGAWKWAMGKIFNWKFWPVVVIGASSCSVPLQECCRFHNFTPQFTIIMLCARQTTDPCSVVSGRSLLYTAMFVEDDREVVSSGRLQSFGGSSMPALRARLWSSSESEWTMWPKNLRRLAMIVWVTGGWADLVQSYKIWHKISNSVEGFWGG